MSTGLGSTYCCNLWATYGAAGLLVVALNGMAAIKLIQGEEAERQAAETGAAPEREEGREGSAGPPVSSAEAAMAAMRLYREALTVIEANQEVGKDGQGQGSRAPLVATSGYWVPSPLLGYPSA
jgi:hypothetical protein